MVNNIIGVTDIPCNDEQQDMLDITKYVGGLEKFIRKCPTPMSIAIQGDWGTGKTSTINMLQKRLNSDGNIKCVYFNTWQYSQFNMSDDLYLSFVNSLVRKCCSQDDKAKDIIDAVKKIGTKFFYNTMKENTGVDLESFFKVQQEKMENVEKLKTKFADMIATELKGKEDGRIVVFIDDLDRLKPEVAVELLEVIKLFMDVDKCIFVLAIDYEVVVSGVRSKYGKNVSEEKCRSFFDKIIQLPFRLPVESYRLEGLIRDTVSDDIEEDDIEALTEFVSELLGANPRAYKRLANSYFLIKSVNEMLQKENDQKLDNVLIFGSLCIQMCVPKFYQLLVTVGDKKIFKEVSEVSSEKELGDFLGKQKLDMELDEKEIRDMYRCLVSFYSFLSEVNKNHKSVKDIYLHLSGVLQMTAITSVSTSSEQKKRSAAIKINKIIVNGQEKTVERPTEAIFEVYKILLDSDMSRITAFMREEERILTDNEERKDGFFRNKRVLCEKNGKTIYIGLSSSTNDKMKFTAKLCRFMKDNGLKAHVRWKNNDVIIFDSENQ